MKYVVEHLDPRLFKWSLLEYQHISKAVGKKNLMFTNLKNKGQINKLKMLGKASQQSVKEIGITKAIVFDPFAKKTFTIKDYKNNNTLIFCGVLGDHPPRKRTKQHFPDSVLPKTWTKRNLGKKQMSTDTAVLVAKMIADGADLNRIRFHDTLVINTGKGEEVKLPYRYVVDEKGQVLLAPGLVDLMKKKGF